MESLGKMTKKELLVLADSLELDAKADDNKDEIIKIIVDSGKYSEEEEQTDFDVKAYERYCYLFIDKMRRIGGKLKPEEQEELNSLKKVVFNQSGKKSQKTNIYKVGSINIYLVEGVPVPNAVYNAFSEYAKKNLFV